MSWQVTLTERLRYLLDDSDTTEYSTNRLSKFLAIAAFEVFNNISLKNSYSVDTTIPSINPDPESTPVAPLIVLKAYEIILRQEYKKLATTAGWKINDDRSSISGQGALDVLKDLLNKAAKQYKDAEVSYLTNDGNIGMAVMGPYTSNQ